MHTLKAWYKLPYILGLSYLSCQMKRRHIFSRSNLLNACFLAIALALAFIPEVKAFTAQKLMQLGLFQPKIPVQRDQQAAISYLPEVLFKDVHGAITDLSALKGRVVFVNFWATWCPPCIAEMPGIHTLYQQVSHHPDLVFMMVDVDDNKKKSLKFLEKRGYTFPLYMPASGIPNKYYDGQIPSTLVFDKKGQLVFQHKGMGDFSNSEFKVFLERLLDE